MVRAIALRLLSRRAEPAAGIGDPAAWARSLGVSRHAVDLLGACDVVDLHVESFVWTRVYGYDLTRRHDRPPLGGRWLGQVDAPRLRAAGVNGVVMSVATNPTRPHRWQARALRSNLSWLRHELGRAGAAVVGDVRGYDAARARGQLAAFLAVQGAAALAPDDLADPALGDLSRVTLVHLTRSRHGSASAPAGGQGGLTRAGQRMVEALREHRVVLDLAHAAPRTFDDALDVHGPGPLLVSHTGVAAVRPSWRNLDDDRVRAVAARGGAIGVIFHGGFLTRPGWRSRASDVVRHLAHLRRVGGEGTPAVGSDYDGLIVPPRDLRTVVALPRLVQAMLDAGFPEASIQAVLGANALRVLRAVRG